MSNFLYICLLLTLISATFTLLSKSQLYNLWSHSGSCSFHCAPWLCSLAKHWPPLSKQSSQCGLMDVSLGYLLARSGRLLLWAFIINSILTILSQSRVIIICGVVYFKMIAACVLSHTPCLMECIGEGPGCLGFFQAL